MSSLLKNFHFVRLSTNTKQLLCGSSNQGLDQSFGEVLLHEWADTVTVCCYKASQRQTQDSNPAPELPSVELAHFSNQRLRTFYSVLVFKTHTNAEAGLWGNPHSETAGWECKGLTWGISAPFQHEIPEGDKKATMTFMFHFLLLALI